MKTTSVTLKPYSLAEIARLYDVCSRTMKKWLAPFSAELDTRGARYFTIAQVRLIFEKLGLPGEVTDD